MATGAGILHDKIARLAKKSREGDIHVGTGPRQGDVESRFRGTWQLASRTPTFNAFSFLPTPPPQKPRLAHAPAVEACEEARSAVLVLEPPAEAPILDRAPADADVLCNILDRYSNYRGYIAKDGECRNNRNQLLGFINVESGQCGSADEEYLGAIAEVSEFDDSVCVIQDALDERCGLLDMGSGYIRDANDRIVAEIKPNGVCTGHAESYLGEFEYFNYHHMKTIALYLMLLDPGMLNEVEG